MALNVNDSDKSQIGPMSLQIKQELMDVAKENKPEIPATWQASSAEKHEQPAPIRRRRNTQWYVPKYEDRQPKPKREIVHRKTDRIGVFRPKPVDLSPLRTTQHVNPSTIGENSMQTTVQIATLNDPVLIISDSESDSGSYEPPVVENYCVDCKQAYASKSTLKKHLKSRKHAEAVAGKTSGIAQQSVNIVNADMSNNARKFRYCGPCNGSFQRIDIHHKTKRHLNNVNAI